jgi:hypothetical protein
MTNPGRKKPPPPHKAGRIKDARGRKVTQLDPVALRLLRQHDVIDADALQAITNEDGVRITRGERAALITGICCALLVIGLFTHALITGDISNARTAKTVGMLYLCSIPWIIWFGIKRKRFGHVAAAMLRYRRCPHCGYDLRMLPVDSEDNATVCPECGCAWILGVNSSGGGQADE